MSIDQTDKRFEIFVPKPKARLNMGRANESDTGPFGYDGVSLHAEDHYYVDIGDDALNQGGGDWLLQADGDLRQFAGGAAMISTDDEMTLSASKKLLIASGAGQGPQTSPPRHGSTLRLGTYNELDLHYVVDGLQTSLFEFFNGRHKRHEDTWIAPNGGVKFEHFFSRKNVLVALTATPAEPECTDALSGGFVGNVSRSWNQLQSGVATADLTQDAHAEPGNVPSVGPIVDAEIAKSKADEALKGMKYGYSSYYSRFDPYSIDKDGWLNKLMGVMTLLKRFTHVALKYGEAINSLPVLNHAIKAYKALDSLKKVAFAWEPWADSIPALATFKKSDDGYEAGEGGVAEEWKEGPGKTDKKFTDPVKDTRQAKIESKAQPLVGWPLPDGQYELTVKWDDGEDELRLDASGPQPAILSFTIPDPNVARTMVLQVGMHPSATVSIRSSDDAAAIGASLTAALGPTAAVSVDGEKVSVAGEPLVKVGVSGASSDLTWTQPGPGTHVLTINGEEVIVSVGPNEPFQAFLSAVVAAVGDRAKVTRTQQSSSDAVLIEPNAPTITLLDSGDTSALAEVLGLEVDSPSGTLVIDASKLAATFKVSIDGTSFKVGLGGFASLEAALNAYAQRGQMDLLAIVSPSGNTVSIETKSKGLSSRIVASFESTKKDERGADGAPEYLTVANLLEFLGELEIDGTKPSSKTEKDPDATHLVIEAEKKGVGSLVEVSGNLASLLFDTPRDEITGGPKASDLEGFETVKDACDTLVGWAKVATSTPAEVGTVWVRPLVTAIEDTVEAVSTLETLVKSVKAVAVKDASPGEEVVGIFGNDGITLGTKDRIVANGGKGIVFISDGGTGSEDRGKFVPTEGWVADLKTWGGKFFFAKKKPPGSERSLGFRVLSDSVVDLTSTVSAQLAALGRGNAAAERPDGTKDGIGIGVARVVGSYAAEMVGYEKVVVSARGPGKDDDEDGETGGRVELLGQRVVVGAIRGTDPKASADLDKIGSKHRLATMAQMGPSPVALAALGGADHLAGGDHQGDKDWYANPLGEWTWNASLREAHPSTSHIDLHATTQIEAVAVPYRMQLVRDEGIRLGITPPDAARTEEALQAEKDDAERERDAASNAKDEINEQLTEMKAEVLGLEASYATMLNPFAHQIAGGRVKWLKRAITSAERTLALRKQALEDAEAALDEATSALQDHQDGKDSHPYPMLEITEDKIRLGFVAGTSEWEKQFSYIEITKDGIKMFQPKSDVPSLEVKEKSVSLTDGTKDAELEGKSGSWTLKYKSGSGKFESGKVTWDDNKFEVDGKTITLG